MAYPQKLTMATPHRPVSTRPTGTGRTSRMSEDYFSDDDDSIGPLPVLKRNASFTRRIHERKEEVKTPETAKDTNLLSVQPQSLSNSWSKGERATIGTITRLPRPRRVLSLDLPGNTVHPCDNMLGRRASMQPGAASRSSQSKRPDPPEQSGSIPLLTHHQTRVLAYNLSQTADQHHTQIEVPKKAVRALSMPVSARTKNSNQCTIAHRKMSAKSTRIQQADKNDDLFLARRSKSIAKSFARPSGIDHDVWVERMVVRQGKSPQVFFKAVFSKECKLQPPTGALNVIYMDELVKVQDPEGGKSQQEAVVAPVVRKQSFWGKTKKCVSTSKEPSKSRSTPLGKLKSVLFLGTSIGKSH